MTSKSKLTPKQEKFCKVFVEKGDASEAYRQSYSTKNMKPATINRKAKYTLDLGKIGARIDVLRERLCKRHDIGLDDLMGELEDARLLALGSKQSGAAVQATMGKAKLLGMDKQVLEHTGPGGSPIQTTNIDPKKLSTTVLKELLAARASTSADG